MPKHTKLFPSIGRLQELFVYDPDTGALTWRVKLGKAEIGSEAGYLNNIGYRQVYFDGEIYSVHRICWALHHCKIPTREVDHENGNRSDNRGINLRHATSAENNQNRRLSTRNKTGVKGVFRVKWNKSTRWRVSVGHSQGQYYITHFQCFGKAVKHANEMRAKLHHEFARVA
jgi:hypothetical protein